MAWSDLFDQRARLVHELEKAGTTIDYLLLDLRDVPDKGLRAEIWRGGYDQERALRLALEYFGDLGNPQPQERTLWFGAGTPDVGPKVVVPGLPTSRTPEVAAAR
jgi:hypothetical protein